jgi:hypothetical protein
VLRGGQDRDTIYGQAGDDQAACGAGSGDFFDGGAGGVDIVIPPDGCETFVP